MSNDIFEVKLAWQHANKPFIYESYSRNYIIKADQKPTLIGTALPGYRGAPEHYNPEQLLIAGLSACHMLSYLSYAASRGIEIANYEDHADGNLEKHHDTYKIQQVTLRPKVTIKNVKDKESALALHNTAHQVCFITNSVLFPVHLVPEIILG